MVARPASGLILFVNQLYENTDFTPYSHVILVEHPAHFGSALFRTKTHGYVDRYHFKRHVLFRAAAQRYYDTHLKDVAHRHYSDIHDYRSRIWTKIPGKISWSAFDPTDRLIEKELNAAGVTVLPTPAFILSREDIPETLSLQYNFYKMMREKTGVLMTHGKPEGGKVRFDDENREAIPASTATPPFNRGRAIANTATYIQSAIEYIGSTFGDRGLGEMPTAKNFNYPIDHAGAKAMMRAFVRYRLPLFGRYQDAEVPGLEDQYLWHSGISAALNLGLLDPMEVVDMVAKSGAPLSSREGFIAQVLGWREYVRAFYIKHGGDIPRSGVFGHKNRLADCWYDGSTGIPIIDDIIKKVHRNAYAHHIERLMYVGNLMLLCEIQPAEVYRWFSEMFWDSYDWVMIPNVINMSQYADGGVMTTKPYFSSSAYILRMTTGLKRGEWSEDWDALYWNFVGNNTAILRKLYRISAQVAFFERKTDAQKAEIRRRARAVIGRLTR